MTLRELFEQNILLGLSVCACMSTIIWCLLLLRKRRSRHERYLVGFIGLISVYQALRIMQDLGFWKATLDPFLASLATLVVTLLFMVALLEVHVFGSEHWQTKMRLRLAEANQVLPPQSPAAVAGLDPAARVAGVKVNADSHAG